MPSQLSRIEQKLDALLTKSGIKPADVVKTAPPPEPRKLTPAEQDALNNAPKPSGISGPQQGAPRVDPATNAPSVAMSVPPAAVGSVTVETVETKPADSAPKGGGPQGAAETKPAERRSERRET